VEEGLCASVASALEEARAGAERAEEVAEEQATVAAVAVDDVEAAHELARTGSKKLGCAAPPPLAQLCGHAAVPHAPAASLLRNADAAEPALYLLLVCTVVPWQLDEQSLGTMSSFSLFCAVFLTSICGLRTFGLFGLRMLPFFRMRPGDLEEGLSLFGCFNL
jgi:hypothetical protein